MGAEQRLRNRRADMGSSAEQGGLLGGLGGYGRPAYNGGYNGGYSVDWADTVERPLRDSRVTASPTAEARRSRRSLGSSVSGNYIGRMRSRDDRSAPRPLPAGRVFLYRREPLDRFHTFTRRSSGVLANDENCSAVVVIPARA